MFFCHEFLSDARFYQLLFRFDQDSAKRVRVRGCPKCGGRLHSARYPRKPSGGQKALGPEHFKRLSFCCAVCRRRVTPPSARFFGRRVYLGAVVVFVTAMLHGPSPQRIARLRSLFDVSWHTVDRWRRWWREEFAKSDFWRVGKGYFARQPRNDELPYSLLAHFGGNHETRMVCMLKLISPLTTGSLANAVFC